MTKLLASTALVAMLAAPAMAQTAIDTTTAPATNATTAPATTDAPMTTEGTTAAPADATTTTTMPADGAAGEMGFGYTAMAGDMSAENFIGKRLYAAEGDVDMNATINEADENWEDIGEISDLVISQDGRVNAVLTDIGGFLGLGERTVAVSMDQLQVIRDGDSDEYFIVFTANREALENAPAFEWMDE